MLTTLLPLLLGLVAWSLNIYACILRKKQYFPTLSWLLCACALWFPIHSWARWAAGEDVAALLDCARAYSLCATVLVAINLLLTGILFLRTKKRND